MWFTELISSKYVSISNSPETNQQIHFTWQRIWPHWLKDGPRSAAAGSKRVPWQRNRLCLSASCLHLKSSDFGRWGRCYRLCTHPPRIAEPHGPRLQANWLPHAVNKDGSKNRILGPEFQDQRSSVKHWHNSLFCLRWLRRLVANRIIFFVLCTMLWFV